MYIFQVDGEACRLLPSIITLSILNKATMLAKRRNAGKPHRNTARLERLKLPVMKIKMSDYETYHHDRDRLKEVAELWLAEPLDLDAATDLETLRKLLAKDYNTDSCCFLDSKYYHFMEISCELEHATIFHFYIFFPPPPFFISALQE